MLVSYDPGVKVAGVALWDGNELTAAWLARGNDWGETALNACLSISEHVPRELVSTYVVEVPQVYTQRKQKGDPNDLIKVALNAGAFVGRALDSFDEAGGEKAHLAQIVQYRPHQWKGQVPKDIAIKRFQKRLSVDELSRIESAPKSLQHNVWDAVGLGLYYMGRR